jgi:hypothetical protein
MHFRGTKLSHGNTVPPPTFTHLVSVSE